MNPTIVFVIWAWLFPEAPLSAAAQGGGLVFVNIITIGVTGRPSPFRPDLLKGIAIFVDKFASSIHHQIRPHRERIAW
jgi:hypothetical protein